MKKFSLIILSILILGWILVACATPPIDDMSRAQDSVNRAENDANVVAYANNTLLQARNSLSRMQSEADARRYDSARNLAAETINHAERAIAGGRAGALRARDEAENTISSLNNLLTETSNAINVARRTQNMQLDFGSISREMNLARQTYDEIRQSFEAGDYPDVISRGQVIRSMLSDINIRLAGAAQATSRKL